MPFGLPAWCWGLLGQEGHEALIGLLGQEGHDPYAFADFSGTGV